MTESRGQWGLSRGSGPHITRKIAGRIVEENLRPQSELEEMNELLEGVTRADLSGPAARWVRSMGTPKAAGAGAGTFEGDDEGLRRSSGYDNFGSQELTSDPSGQIGEEISDEDREGRSNPRAESGDFHRRNEHSQKSSDGIDDADSDLWEMDLYDDTNDRNRERGYDGPIITASLTEKELEQEIEDLFSVE